MGLLQNIPYRESFVVKDNLTFQSQKQKITITKHFCDSDIFDRYYLRANTIDGTNSDIVNQGYLYFYLDFFRMQSRFIGVGVAEEYRNFGIASLLISSWIQLCMDEGFINLETIPKQKKPFVLYLLKKYAFDLNDLNTYHTSSKLVHICKKENDDRKCIMFENKQEERRFYNSNIMKTDNYSIVTLEDDVQILDSVVLGSPYFLKDADKAYQKSIQVRRNR